MNDIENLRQVIPDEKLAHFLASATPEANKKNVIVLSTGSLCPVHLMHREMVEVAIRHLENTGNYNVLAGYLSPSQDIYVSTKLGDKAINATERSHMVQLICQDSVKVDVSRWESTRPGCFIDYPAVVRFHSKYFNDILPEAIPELKPFLPIRVVYVCGSDHALRCSLFSLKRSGVVVVPRPGITPANRDQLAEHHEVAKQELEDISSTLIRKKLQNKDSLEELCGPVVSKHLYQLFHYDV